jgi:adenosylcobinamide-phosphate synthase
VLTGHGRAAATAGGLLVGVGLDFVFGDPRRGHPVALFGSGAARLESAMWRDNRLSGAVYAATLCGAAAGLGYVMRQAAGTLPGAGSREWFAPSRSAHLGLLATTAAGTWVVLGGRSLVTEADRIRRQLLRGDLPAARSQLSNLVGRKTDALDGSEIVRATIESVAENTSDAVVAPLFWGAVAGLPGLFCYRAANTLDAMVGHHNRRYEQFGWATARADDVANFVPARLTAALAAVLAPVVSGEVRAALHVIARDGRRHPSPNAGMAEAAFAGALGIRLGGCNDYRSRVEYRPVLGGEGRTPVTVDVARAMRLSRAVTVAAAFGCAAISALRWRRVGKCRS